jgi:hypothetical protein
LADRNIDSLASRNSETFGDEFSVNALARQRVRKFNREQNLDGQ